MSNALLIRHAPDYFDEERSEVCIKTEKVLALATRILAGKLPGITIRPGDTVIGVHTHALRTGLTLHTLLEAIGAKKGAILTLDTDYFEEGRLIQNLFIEIRNRLKELDLPDTPENNTLPIIIIGHLPILEDAGLPCENCQGAVLDFERARTIARV